MAKAWDGKVHPAGFCRERSGYPLPVSAGRPGCCFLRLAGTPIHRGSADAMASSSVYGGNMAQLAQG